MPIMGSTEPVDGMTVSKINKWKHIFFNANNVCYVLTGNFSNDDYNEFIKKLDLIERSVVIIPKKATIIAPKNFCDRDSMSDVIVDSEWAFWRSL